MIGPGAGVRVYLACGGHGYAQGDRWVEVSGEVVVDLMSQVLRKSLKKASSSGPGSDIISANCSTQTHFSAALRVVVSRSPARARVILV